MNTTGPWPRLLRQGIACALMAFLLWPDSTATAEVYGYDRAGRLTQVVYEDGTIVRYTYDDNSNILNVQVLGDDLFADGFEQ